MVGMKKPLAPPCLLPFSTLSQLFGKLNTPSISALFALGVRPRYPFTHDPLAMQDIAAAWRGFVQLVLDEHAQRVGRLHIQQASLAGSAIKELLCP